MSRTLEYKGIRRVNKQIYTFAACGTNFKHFQVLAQMYTPGFFEEIKGIKYGGASAAAEYVTNAATDEGNIMTSTGVAMVDDDIIKIKKNRVKVEVRNNNLSTVVMGFFHVKPRNMIPDIIGSVSATAVTTLNVIPKMVIEGLADKLSVAAGKTTPMIIQHNDVATAGTNLATSWNAGGVYDTWSLNPALSLFDSAVFCSWFKVKKVDHVKLKPGDECVYYMDVPGQFFPDGIEVFKGAETLMYDFTELLIVDLQGVIGHLATNALATPTYLTAVTGNKPGWNAVGYDSGVVDIVITYDFEVEAFVADITEPGIGFVLDADHDQDNLGEAYVQAEMDIETNA